MFDTDNIHQAQSHTAVICENAALYGATPERDEFDPRSVWDRDEAIEAVSEAFRILARGVAPDGMQIADERESMLWGFVNMWAAPVHSAWRLRVGGDRRTGLAHAHSPHGPACGLQRAGLHPSRSAAGSRTLKGASHIRMQRPLMQGL